SSSPEPEHPARASALAVSAAVVSVSVFLAMGLPPRRSRAGGGHLGGTGRRRCGGGGGGVMVETLRQWSGVSPFQVVRGPRASVGSVPGAVCLSRRSD